MYFSFQTYIYLLISQQLVMNSNFGHGNYITTETTKLDDYKYSIQLFEREKKRKRERERDGEKVVKTCETKQYT